jgi:hypothetical protein
VTEADWVMAVALTLWAACSLFACVRLIQIVWDERE